MYATLYDLIQAMRNGEVSKKNKIQLDSNYVFCDERYNPDGTEVICPEGKDEDDFEYTELYHGDENPEYELILLLKAVGIDAGGV